MANEQREPFAKQTKSQPSRGRQLIRNYGANTLFAKVVGDIDSVLLEGVWLETGAAIGGRQRSAAIQRHHVRRSGQFRRKEFHHREIALQTTHFHIHSQSQFYKPSKLLLEDILGNYC